MNKASYSLKAVCKITGLKVATLHAWERRYGAVKPLRMHSGHRVYSAHEVEKLTLLVAARDLGHPISQVAGLSLLQLRVLVHGQEAQQAVPADALPPPRPARSTAFCRRTLQALAAYDLERVHEELQSARSRFDTATFILGILVPLFSQMRKMVARQELSVSREHALSAIIMANLQAERLRLRQSLIKNADKLYRRSKRVALATMDGDYHEFGIQMAAVLCASVGLTVAYLGASLPAEALAEALLGLRVDLLILSCPKVGEDYLEQSADAYLRTLRQRLPSFFEIWLGGDDAASLVARQPEGGLTPIKSLQALYRLLTRNGADKGDCS